MFYTLKEKKHEIRIVIKNDSGLACYVEELIQWAPLPLALIEALFMEFSLHKIAKKQFYFIFGISQFILAMYKTRNTGTGDGMRGTRGMGRIYIPGNVIKNSGECPQIFWEMFTNISREHLRVGLD